MGERLSQNPGRLPSDCDGRAEGKIYRVRVKLHNGYDSAVTEPLGWPAAGMSGCDWRKSNPPHPFQIRLYERLQ
jgi:hypothetical protein